jgi:hypothetical protein
MSTTQLAVVDKQLETDVEILRSKAEAIVVKTPEDYIAVCNIVVQGRGFIKRWKNVFAESIRSAKEHLQNIQSEEKRHIVAAEAVVAIAERKGEEWKREERQKAEAEQRRLNEENRRIAAEKAEAERKEQQRLADERRKEAEKAAEAARKSGDIGKREAERIKKEAAAQAEKDKARADFEAVMAKENVQDVTVKAAVPTVAGIKARVNWRYRVVDESKIPRAFMIRNDVKIGQMVRDAKNKAIAEASCPGIEVYTEDSI